MNAHYLLDTSAFAAHLLQGPGAEFIADCLRKGAAACVLSAFEFAMFMRRSGVDQADIETYWQAYRSKLRQLVAVDETLVATALEIRGAAATRLPLADACIAACAARHGLPLVHADNHYHALPASIKTIDVREITKTKNKTKDRTQ